MSLDISFNLQREDFAMHVELTLPETGVTAIFGPSGSGKTTLLRAIAGLENIFDSKVIFKGQCWQSKSSFVPTHLRPIGYVFQEPSLFPHLSIKQNLEYGLTRVVEKDRRVSLANAVELLDIDHLLRRQPHTLSGGEQQRVAIARALAVSPLLLLMDEPLSSLDNKLKQEILPYLESLHRELTIPVIYVSHATDEVARLADTLVILKAGEILGSGPIQDMLTRLDLPLSHRHDAETLIHGTVITTDPEFGLTSMACGDLVFTVAGNTLASGTNARLRIAAQDVSLTLKKQTGTSIQNIFPATVVELQTENHAQIMVKLQLGDFPLLARLTRKSVEELAIKPGMQVYAQIKSVAVLA
jgi:molybdate transport system ATP-binding protein